MNNRYQDLVEQLVNHAISHMRERGYGGPLRGPMPDEKEITITYGHGDENAAMRVLEFADEEEMMNGPNISTEEWVRDACALSFAAASAFGGPLNVNWKDLGCALLETVLLHDTMGTYDKKYSGKNKQYQEEHSIEQ